jgi:hypothetical protein
VSAALLALAALLSPPASPAQADTGRLSSVRASCVGPLSGFEVAWPEGSAARVTLALAAGETRALELPLPLPLAAAGAGLAPAVSVRGAGSVQLDPWPGASAREFAELWARVPIALRLRPAPPAGDGAQGSTRLPWRALFAAGACLALALALRERPRAALGAGLLGAVLALALARPDASFHAAGEVLEGDGTAWVLARAARSRLALEGALPAAWLATLPPELPLSVAGDGSDWSASARGALLLVRRPLTDLPPDALGARNALEDLPRCWVRGADGLWSHRGPWARGALLPEPVPGPPPPAALVAGLPAGQGLLLAERSRGEHPESARAWLRLTGFDPGATPIQGSGGERD